MASVTAAMAGLAINPREESSVTVPLLIPPSDVADMLRRVSECSKKAVDARTGGCITSSTELAALYTFKNSAIDNQLLKDLTGIAEPIVRCGIQIDGGSVYPPSQPKGKSGYDLYLTYNKLVCQPIIPQPSRTN